MTSQLRNTGYGLHGQGMAEFYVCVSQRRLEREGRVRTFTQASSSPMATLSSSSSAVASAGLVALDFLEGVSTKSSSESFFRFLPVEDFGVAAFLTGVAVPFFVAGVVGVVEVPVASRGFARNASASRLSLLNR